MIGVRQIIEIDAWNVASESLTTLRYSTGAFTTKANETPANTLIPGGIIDPGLLKYAMFTGGKTSGASSYSFGEAILNNQDKSLDYLKAYSFDGRELRLFEGPLGNLFPSGFTQVSSSVIAGIPSFTWDKVTFSLQGKQLDMNATVPSGVFQGTNARPNGIEGEDDLLGKYKPMLLGRRENISPPCCNTVKLIYAVSPLNGIAVSYMGSEFQVYDTGLSLTFDGLYTSQSDMETNAPAPGTYRVWEQGGHFRLGTSPSGQITCDAVSYGRSVTAMPGNLILDLMNLREDNLGLSRGSTYDISTINALNAAFRAECGVWIAGGSLAPVTLDKAPTGTSYSSVLDSICSACGAYWYFDQFGVMKVGQFVDPATKAAAYTISTATTIVSSVTISKTQDTKGGIPTYALTLLRSHNETVQDNLETRVTDARKLWLKEEWRKTQVLDYAVKTSHPLSEELSIETSLVDDNPAEATRRAGLYGVPRDLIEIVVPHDTFGHTSNLVPGLCIQLHLEDTNIKGTTVRFGVIQKKMLVLNFTINKVTELITITLWG